MLKNPKLFIMVFQLCRGFDIDYVGYKVPEHLFFLALSLRVECLDRFGHSGH